MQVASQMSLSDAAMEATLSGRAEYACILADLGFVDSDYAARCNMSGIQEDPDGQNAMSGNARVIKAAICAGKAASRYTEILCGCPSWQSPGRLYPKNWRVHLRM